MNRTDELGAAAVYVAAQGLVLCHKATQPNSEMASRLREAVDQARKSAGLPALPAVAVAVAAVPGRAAAAGPAVASIATGTCPSWHCTSCCC